MLAPSDFEFVFVATTLLAIGVLLRRVSVLEARETRRRRASRARDETRSDGTRAIGAAQPPVTATGTPEAAGYAGLLAGGMLEPISRIIDECETARRAGRMDERLERIERHARRIADLLGGTPAQAAAPQATARQHTDSAHTDSTPAAPLPAASSLPVEWLPVELLPVELLPPELLPPELLPPELLPVELLPVTASPSAPEGAATAQAENSPASSEARELDPGAFLRAAFDSHLGPARARGIAMHLEAEPVPTVRANPFLLTHALRHLLSAAIESAPRVPGDVTVALGEIGGEVLFAVADNGPGLDAERLAAIFNPEARVAGDNAPETLAYASARAMSLALGGTFLLDTAPGAGTRATIRLPAAAPAPPSVLAPTSAHSRERTGTRTAIP